MSFEIVLCNLGASVSLMPLFVYEKLRLSGMKSHGISLQLTDRSVKYPVGIVEDLQIRIEQLIILTDFVIMDIQEDFEISILLGRSFLATVKEIIDVKQGKLTFEVWDENIEFLLSKLIKISIFKDSCCRFDIVKKHVNESPSEPIPRDRVKVYLVSAISQGRKDKGVEAYEKILDEILATQN